MATDLSVTDEQVMSVLVPGQAAQQGNADNPGSQSVTDILNSISPEYAMKNGIEDVFAESRKGFSGIRGKLLDSNYQSARRVANRKDIDGTKDNYLYWSGGLYGLGAEYSYVAPILANGNKAAADAAMNKWKTRLSEAFSGGGWKVEENQENNGTRTITFSDGVLWNYDQTLKHGSLIKLKRSMEKGTYKVDLILLAK